MSKRCPVCQKILEIAAFPRDLHDVLGAMTVCKKCQAKERRVSWELTQERLKKRPPHSERAAKKKCPACQKYVFVEPLEKIGTCYVCGKRYQVVVTLGDGTTPDNAHGIRLRLLDVPKKTRGK